MEEFWVRGPQYSVGPPGEACCGEVERRQRQKTRNRDRTQREQASSEQTIKSGLRKIRGSTCNRSMSAGCLQARIVDAYPPSLENVLDLAFIALIQEK